MKQQADAIKWIPGQCLIGLPDRTNNPFGDKFTPQTKMVEFFAFAKKSAARADLIIYNMMNDISNQTGAKNDIPPSHINCRSRIETYLTKIGDPTTKNIAGENLHEYIPVSTCKACNGIFVMKNLDADNLCAVCRGNKGEFKA